MAQPRTIGDVTYEQLDLREASDELIAEITAFGNILRAESHPTDPPRPVETAIANVRNIPSFVVPFLFLARDRDGTLIADADAVVFRTDDNQHLLQGGVAVHPDHRRRGIGKELFRLLVDTAEAQGRRTIMGSTTERVAAGAAFAEGMGAERGIEERVSRLVLADVDRDLVRRWVDEGPGRAPGYSLVAIDGPYPDDLIPEIATVHGLMNTAPRDDLDMEDWEVKPEHLREEDKRLQATGGTRWSLFAKHEDSGNLVGFTEVGWNPKVPSIIGQYGTAVHPDHRGHALGKWLKAVMLQRILDECPDAVEIRTGNAFSNDAMLGINIQLGFELYFAAIGWQISTEKARAYVGSSS